MADSHYQQLHAVSGPASEHSAQVIDAETGHCPPQNACRSFPDLQDLTENRCQSPHGSESTTHITVPVCEHHPPQEPNAPHHETTFLVDSEISDLSGSMGMTDDEPGNDFQRPALDEQAKNLHLLWTDAYFRPQFLISLSVFLICIIAVLEALYYISQHNQGLVTASEDMHYMWTYGPTFGKVRPMGLASSWDILLMRLIALTMVAALWGQLEQRARQIIPWCLMSRQKIPAQNSLMLNYVTSSTLGSLVRSLKRKHFLVSISICGSLIFRLIIIFTAGLLRLEYRSLASGRDFIAKDIFDPSTKVSSLSWDAPETTFPTTNGLNYWATFKYGLPYPHGITSQFAVQSFAADDDGQYDQLEAEIQVFESSLENCEPFTFTYDTEGLLDDTTEIPMSLVAPGSVRGMMRPWCYPSNNYYNSSEFVAESLLINSTSLIYKCTNSTPVEDQDHRILCALEFWLSSSRREISGFMCKPRYSLTRRAVTNSTRNGGARDGLNITGDITETLNIGVRPFNMTSKILTSLSAGRSIDIPEDVEWNVWYTILNATQPQTDLWSFRNTSLVMELTQRMWKNLAAYIVKHDYTSPSNATINGTATATLGRLRVQKLSLRLIEAHITLLIALIVALCFLRPGVFLRNPTSLGAHSIILARSPALMGLLQGHGAASKQTLQASLSGYLASFPLHISAESSAIALSQSREESEELDEKPTADNRHRRKWWSPLSTRTWFRICLMTAILIVVMALEVMLRISNHENGLGDVSLNGYLKYTWSFLPSVVLVLVGILFSMVDSTARTLHLFQLLRKGRATTENMLHDPARQVSLVAVVHAVRERHFVLLWAMIPSLIAPFLTVITSGLYMVVPVPLTYEAELELKDWFRLENRSINDINLVEARTGEPDTVFTLIQFSNMSYPQWTHGEYAFASFGADNLHSRDGNDSSLYVTARVPAARVNLNCSLIGHFANETYPATQQDDLHPLWLQVDPRPLGCLTPAQNDTAGQRDLYLRNFDVTNEDGTRNTNRGYYYSLLLDDYNNFIMFNDSESQGMGVFYTNTTGVCGDVRQHYFLGLGYGMEALSLLHCMPYVEALWVTAAFALPDLSLVPTIPITPDRDTAMFLANAASRTESFKITWKQIVVAMINGSSGIGQLTGLPSDPDNDDSRRLIANLERTYAEYLAQVLHFNHRLPPGDNEINASSSSAGQNPLTSDGHPATGTVTDRTRLRLKQNAVSTRILQGLLGVMGACLVASTALGRGARVIPRDPGSIASKMAYFADGEVWRHVPVGADRWTDERIKKHGLGISGGKLLLDWWGNDREDSGDGTRGKKFAVDSADRKGMP